MTGLETGGLQSLANGTGAVTASAAGVSLVLPVVVAQVVSQIRLTMDTVTLHWIGATGQLGASATDRRGVPVAGVPVSWRGTNSLVAEVGGGGSIRAVGPGLAGAVASARGVEDTISVAVVQVPASMTVTPVLDTMDLDSVRTPTIVVIDSGGSVIASPGLRAVVSDASILSVGAGGAITAALPGDAMVTYRAGEVAATVERVVEGTAIVINGQRSKDLDVYPGPVPFTITNGRIRLSWSRAEMDEIASVEMDVRLGNTWYPANARRWGDWVYVASSIRTMPTQVSIIENSPDRVGLAMRFDDHWFMPSLAGYDPALGLVDQPYPFVRTIWLRKGDSGYYSWVDLFKDLHLQIVEHETGFGGLWGPATIRTNHLELRTDTLSRTVTYNGNPGLPAMGALVDAAEFIRDGDPVRRLLVPLPEAPFITPVFPGWGYGSVYRYGSPSQSYGAYMYATGLVGGPSAAAVCRDAWRNAPFPLHPVTDADLANCGPPPQ